MQRLPFILYFLLANSLGLCSDTPNRWVINDGKSLGFEQFYPYSLVILETSPDPMLVETLREQDKEVLAHLHLTKIDPKSRFYQMAQNKKLLIPDSKEPSEYSFVDVTKKEWIKMVIEEIIPHILFSRFDGLLLSDISPYLSTKKENSQGYQEASEAIIRLIKRSDSTTHKSNSS